MEVGNKVKPPVFENIDDCPYIFDTRIWSSYLEEKNFKVPWSGTNENGENIKFSNLNYAGEGADIYIYGQAVMPSDHSTIIMANGKFSNQNTFTLKLFYHKANGTCETSREITGMLNQRNVFDNKLQRDIPRIYMSEVNDGNFNITIDNQTYW